MSAGEISNCSPSLAGIWNDKLLMLFYHYCVHLLISMDCMEWSIDCMQLAGSCYYFTLYTGLVVVFPARSSSVSANGNCQSEMEFKKFSLLSFWNICGGKTHLFQKNIDCPILCLCNLHSVSLHESSHIT